MIIKQFYELVFDATKIAFGSTANTIIRDISIVGINIRLRFAGVALMPYVMPALEHLIEKENEVVPEYTIEIWDSNSTQIDFPHAPCEIDDIQVRGEIKGFTSDRFESAFFTHARMLTLIDHETKYGIVCFADTLDIPAFELACPLRGILSWI